MTARTDLWELWGSNRPEPPGRAASKRTRTTTHTSQTSTASLATAGAYHMFLLSLNNQRQERETFLKITRGLPELRKLREVMDEVYHLYECCCRPSVLERLRKLRERVRRFKRLSQALKKLERRRLIVVCSFWMTSSCHRPRMLWSGAIAGFARCRKRYIVFERMKTFAIA